MLILAYAVVSGCRSLTPFTDMFAESPVILRGRTEFQTTRPDE